MGEAEEPERQRIAATVETASRPASMPASRIISSETNKGEGGRAARATMLTLIAVAVDGLNRATPRAARRDALGSCRRRGIAA